MKYEFDIRNQSRFSDSKLFSKITLEKAKKLMAILKFQAGSSIEINFVSKEKIKKINNEYLCKNYTTDVLSFANPVDNPNIPFIGTIFVCPSIIDNCEKSNFQSRIAELLFHGIMHLSGKIHQNQNDINRWEKFLNKNGIL